MKFIKIEKMHIKQVATLSSKLFEENALKEESIEQMLTNSVYSGYIVNCDDNNMGYILVSKIMDEMEIISIGILEEYRGKRIAEKLIKKCIDKNILSIFLEVRPSNTKAVTLYERMNFKLAHVRPNYYDNPLENAFVYMLYMGGIDENSKY